MVRAKFVLQSFETQLAFAPKNTPQEEVRTLRLTAVTDNSPENKEFFKWTPSGEIKIGVLNQKAWAQFHLGHEYYVDFTPVASYPEQPKHLPSEQ